MAFHATSVPVAGRSWGCLNLQFKGTKIYREIVCNRDMTNATTNAIVKRLSCIVLYLQSICFNHELVKCFIDTEEMSATAMRSTKRMMVCIVIPK